MQVIVLPGSGKDFTQQLAILQHLCEIDYIPSLLLGSSGGNLSAYIAVAADFKSNRIELLARELKSHFFAVEWSTVKPIANIIGFFNGNAFNTGYGLSEFMHTYFIPKLITKYEIWTGCFNQDLQKFRLFCNKSKDESIIDCNDIDY